MFVFALYKLLSYTYVYILIIIDDELRSDQKFGESNMYISFAIDVAAEKNGVCAFSYVNYLGRNEIQFKY